MGTAVVTRSERGSRPLPDGAASTPVASRRHIRVSTHVTGLIPSRQRQVSDAVRRVHPHRERLEHADDAAAARDAAEEESAFSHPAVAPDATAAYGDHPDQVIDFYAPARRGAGRPAPRSSSCCTAAPGGPPYDRRHVTPFADFLARRGFAVANVEYRRGSSLPAQTGRAGTGPGRAGAGRRPSTTSPPRWTPCRPRRDGPAAGRPAPHGRHRPLGRRSPRAVGRRPARPPGRRPRGALPAPPPLRGVVALAPIADFAVAEKLDVCGGAARQLLGGQDEFAERRPYADPALLLPTGIATALVQGRADIVVPQAVAEAYADAAAKAGEVVGLTLLEDVGHFPLIDPAADACAVVAEEIAQLAW